MDEKPFRFLSSAEFYKLSHAEMSAYLSRAAEELAKQALYYRDLVEARDKALKNDDSAAPGTG